MEQVKVDKRSKEYKDAIKAQADQGNLGCSMALPKDVYEHKELPKSWLQKMIESGIPLDVIQFHAAVCTPDKIPETHFSSKSNNKNRVAEMWLTGGGNVLLLKQNGKYFGCHAAEAAYYHFKAE